MVRSSKPETKRHQSQICTQKGRTFHYHRCSIPNHLPPLPSTNLEYPPGIPCFSLIALSENTVHSPNFPKPPPDLITGEEEYEIDRILCHRGTSRNRSFLIQWKGYLAEEDSWIPEANLSHTTEALQEYKTLHPSAFPPRIRVISHLQTGLPQPAAFPSQILPAYPSSHCYHLRPSQTYQLSVSSQHRSWKPCTLVLQD